VEARNQLEGYLYGLRNSLADGLAEKLEASDKEALETELSAALKWLEENQEAPKADYEDKQKSVEEVAKPIISKAYSADSEPPSGDTSTVDEEGPEIEIAEVTEDE